MNKKELEAFARKAAKSIKTEKDLCDFSQMLKKIAVETALNVELDDHLGYDKHQASVADNSRNGYSSKTLITEDGSFEVDIPRIWSPPILQDFVSPMTGTGLLSYIRPVMRDTSPSGLDEICAYRPYRAFGLL